MRGLYLITNDDPLNVLLEKLAVALATRKIALLQYRRKKIAAIDQVDEVAEIKTLCEKFSVPLLINDDIALAEKYALGVHLGQSDGEILEARARLPDHAIIGRTCLNSIDLAKKAIAEGATYVAFGAIYTTSTKPEAGCIGLEVLQQASQQFDVPICAIGGLTVENADVVLESGADLCAVVSDILSLDIEDIAQRVHAWANLFV